jgi:membrane protein DedA with SNARE-associated domain
MAELQAIFDYLSAQPMWWGLLVLAASAMLEYLFPPFPGDTITLAGAVLIPQAGWSPLAVFGAVMLGTTAGAAVDWRVGVWLADHREGDTWLHEWLRRDKVAERVDKLIAQFREHGAIYVTLNRFVPAFRALFFVASGLARLHLGKVLFFGCIGAGLWNGAILGAGYMVGYKLEALAALVDRYSRIFWFVLAAIAIVALIRKLVLWMRD